MFNKNKISKKYQVLDVAALYVSAKMIERKIKQVEKEKLKLIDMHEEICQAIVNKESGVK